MAIDLSEKTPDAFERTSNGTFKPSNDAKSREQDRGTSEEHGEATLNGTIPDATGIAPPILSESTSPIELPQPRPDVSETN